MIPENFPWWVGFPVHTQANMLAPPPFAPSQVTWECISVGMTAPQLKIQHLQHLWTPLTLMGGPPTRLMVDWGRASSPPHTILCTTTMATRDERQPQSGCTPCWNYDMMPSYGSLPKKEWQTLSPCLLPSDQPSRNMRNTPQPKPIPSSMLCNQQQEENSFQLLEWLPQCTPTWRWLPFHHLHHALVDTPDDSLRLFLASPTRWGALMSHWCGQTT